MQFYLGVFTFFAFLFAGLTSAFAGGGLHDETPARLGSPLYVLEQDASLHQADRSVRLWEIRPSERREALMHSGSRLLFLSRNIQVAAFALVGHRISSDSIHAGSLLLLDHRGQLHFSPLGEEERHEGLARTTRLPGRYTVLEQGAESIVYAVDDRQNIVSIHSNGQVRTEVLASVYGLSPQGERIVSLSRDLENFLWALTSSGRMISVFNWQIMGQVGEAGAGDYRHMAITEEALWLQQGSTLKRIPWDKSVTQILDLSELAQSTQDGGAFQILGIDRDRIIARAGAHAYVIEKSLMGTRLSRRVLATDFFGTGLRRFGVHYSLHNTVSILQPRAADRTGHRRQDLRIRDNPLLPEVSKGADTYGETDAIGHHAEAVAIKSQNDLQPLLYASTSTSKKEAFERLKKIIELPARIDEQDHKCEDLLIKPL